MTEPRDTRETPEKTAKAREKGMAFEEALARLEQIVAEMEEGKLPVDAMMKKFEEGMKLSTYCNRKLGEIRRKIEILVTKSDGQTEWREVDPGQVV